MGDSAGSKVTQQLARARARADGRNPKHELEIIEKKTILKTDPEPQQRPRDRITTRDPRTECTKKPNEKPTRKAPGTTLA